MNLPLKCISAVFVVGAVLLFCEKLPRPEQITKARLSAVEIWRILQKDAVSLTKLKIAKNKILSQKGEIKMVQNARMTETKTQEKTVIKNGVWEKTREASKEAWDKTREVSAETWDKTKEVSEKVWDKTKEVLTGDK